MSNSPMIIFQTALGKISTKLTKLPSRKRAVLTKGNRTDDPTIKDATNSNELLHKEALNKLAINTDDSNITSSPSKQNNLHVATKREKNDANNHRKAQNTK